MFFNPQPEREFSENKGTYEQRYINHSPYSDESISRLRRFRAFIQCTGLIEETFVPSFKHSELFKKIREIRDHITFLWLGRRSSIPLILAEPYFPGEFSLQTAGVNYLVLPENIGPYGGGPFPTEIGDPAPCKSILCSHELHKKHLDKLKINIIKASEHLSPWNSVNEAERKAAKKRGVQLKKNIIRGPWNE